MNISDAIKFAMADLVTRNIQQQGSWTGGVSQSIKQFAGFGGVGAAKGAETQSYTGGLSASANEASAALRTLAASATAGAQSLRGSASAGGGGGMKGLLAGGGSDDTYGIAGDAAPPGGWKFKSAFTETGEAAKGMAGKEGGLMSAAEVAGGSAEGAGGLAEGAAAAGGSLLGVAAAGFEIAAKFVSVTIALKDYGDSMVEANRHLGRWNGNLAVANARYDIQSIQLERQTAHNTGGSATMVTDMQMELRDQFQPIAEDLQILKNVATSVVIEIAKDMTAVLRLFDKIVGPLLHLIDHSLQSGEHNLPIADLFSFLKTDTLRSKPEEIKKAREESAKQGAVAKKASAEEETRENAALYAVNPVLGAMHDTYVYWNSPKK